MIAKSISRRRGMVRVAFSVAPVTPCNRVFLVGDFNDWQPHHPMRRCKDGSWGVSVELEAGRSYEFRYLLDGERWLNEPAADGYTSNPFGTENCVVDTVRGVAGKEPPA